MAVFHMNLSCLGLGNKLLTHALFTLLLFSSSTSEPRTYFQPSPLGKRPDRALPPTLCLRRASKATRPLSPRLAAAKLVSVLDDVTKARRKSMELKGIEYADQLSSQLLAHAKLMEGLFEDMQKQLKKESPDEKVLKRLIASMDEKSKWLSKAEAKVPNSLK